MGLPTRERKRRALALLAARLCRPQPEESNAEGVQPPGGEQRLRIGDILEKMCLGDLLREEDDAHAPFDPVNEAAVATPERRSGGGGRSGGSRRGGRRKGEKAISSSSPPPPPRPRCMLSRWLPSKQFLKCRVSEGEFDEEEVAEEQADVVESAGGRGSGVFLRSEVGASTLLSAGRAEAATASASRGGQDSACTDVEGKSKDSDFGVRNPEQTFLNVGMGASLVFLLTRSITEFNKMTELRREVETLLKEVKDAVRKHDGSPNPVESKNTTLAFSYSDSWGDTEVTTQESNNLPLQQCPPCLKLPEAPSYDGHLKHEGGHADAKSLDQYQMEIAELESELEVLQLNLDKHDSEGGQLMTELSDKRTQVSDSFSVTAGRPIRERVVEEKEANTRYQFGVCPRELTRRLHDLLEASQEERITELESALQLAHIKLREKEMEASWWRDTARLASQQNHESNLLLRS